LRRAFVYSMVGPSPSVIDGLPKMFAQVPPLNLTLQISDLNDDEMIKNELSFLKIKFHSKENIEWHCTQFEFNSNSNLIELRCN
jgi:hypothetical protein